MLCFVALFVFAVLGLFSAKYRSLFFEALGCVTRTLTLRPCESKLDERIKATLIATLLQRSPPAGRFVHQHFAALSLIFTLLFFGSMIYSGIAVYNYWAYGNCNGPQSTAFCAFDAVLRPGASAANLSTVPSGVGPRLGKGSIVMVEFGCFSCPYTRAAQAPLRQFLDEHPEVSLEFRAFPIPTHNDSFQAAQAAFCAQEQGKFWEYHDALFADSNHSATNLKAMAQRLGLEAGAFASCMASNTTSAGLAVERDVAAGHAAGIYGTPTFFISGVSVVGPQSVAEFEAGLKGQGSGSSEQASSCQLPNASH